MFSDFDPVSAGVLAVVVAIVLGLFEFLRRIWPAAESVGYRPVTIECPNKIHDLDKTLDGIKKGIGALELAHRPVDGIERWKRDQMQDTLLQTVIDRLNESVTLQTKSLHHLERIADRAITVKRKVELPDDERKSKPESEP